MDTQETSLFTTVLIVATILGIIIAFFIISMVRQQQRSMVLYKKSILTEITTLERERSRIAADLHDEVGPMLSAVKLKLASLDTMSEEDEEELQKTNQHIDELIRRMREISYDLMPNTLKRKGLVNAIQEFIQYIGKTNPLSIELNVMDEINLNEEKSIHLYRITQEIIHNTIKHADASKLHIGIFSSNSLFVLTTKDNGKGYDHSTENKNAGLGLRNLLTRTEIMGGKMYVESKKNIGTTYTFEIPLNS